MRIAVRLYLPEDLAQELREEGQRQDRSMSWLLCKAWRIARPEIRKAPSEGEPEREEARP